MGKEIYEEKCLNDFLNAKGSHWLARSISSLQKYKKVDGWKETPDFLLKRDSSYIGIEHFVIDVFKVDMEGQSRSGSRLACGKQNDVYNRYHDKLLIGEFDATDAGRDIQDVINKELEILSLFEYSRFVENYKRIFEKHLGKNYFSSGGDILVNESVPLFFLIEERGMIKELGNSSFACSAVRNDGAYIKLAHTSEIPITSDIIDIWKRGIGVVSGIIILSYGLNDTIGKVDRIKYINLSSEKAIYESIESQRIEVYRQFFYDIPNAKVKLKVE